jgi:hypothetical protein
MQYLNLVRKKNRYIMLCKAAQKIVLLRDDPIFVARMYH